jgi:hypothetical protein
LKEYKTTIHTSLIILYTQLVAQHKKNASSCRISDQ